MKRWIVGGVVVLVGIAAVVAGGMAWKIGPRNLIGMALYDQRREGDLVVGQVAPDVELLALDGTTAVPLLSRRSDRPLVVVFGSFT